jgi:hypothetical protein
MMNNFLKGTYNVDLKIEDQCLDEEGEQSEFERAALNSIGGSMVFVERKKMKWSPESEDLNE